MLSKRSQLIDHFPTCVFMYACVCGGMLHGKSVDDVAQGRGGRQSWCVNHVV